IQSPTCCPFLGRKRIYFSFFESLKFIVMRIAFSHFVQRSENPRPYPIIRLLSYGKNLFKRKSQTPYSSGFLPIILRIGVTQKLRTPTIAFRQIPNAFKQRSTQNSRPSRSGLSQLLSRFII